jgi:hypothetical protein
MQCKSFRILVESERLDSNYLCTLRLSSQGFIPLDEVQVLADQNGLLFLIADLYPFHDDAMFRPLRIFAFLVNGSCHINRVAQENRQDETHVVVAIRHRARIDIARGHSNGDTQNQRAVRDSPPERLCPAPRFIHMMRVEIAGLPGMQNYIRFGNGSAAGSSLIADPVLLK